MVYLQLGVADRDLGFGFAAAAGQLAVAGTFAGGEVAGRDGGLAGDGAQVLVAFLVPGPAGALAGLVVQRGLPAPGGQVAAGGDLVMSTPVSATRPGRSGGPSRAWILPAGAVPHRGQQPLDDLGQLADLGGEAVDALQHGLEQGGVLGGEELRAFHGVLQLGDLAAGPGAGQLGQDLGVAFPGDQVVHDVPAGDPVQVGDHRGQLDRR